MLELFAWLSTHPDVKVGFHKDSILDSLFIRVMKGQYISVHTLDEIERAIYLRNDEDATKLIMSIISHLYGEIEKEEARCKE